MKFLKIAKLNIFAFSLFLSVHLILSLTLFSSEAFARPFWASSEFKITPEMAPRVEFWKLIFAKYGRNHSVFHNRRHPQIIYSILDFSDFAPKNTNSLGLSDLSPEMKKRKKKALEIETNRIRALLQKLNKSGPSKDENETRIYSMFQKLKNPKTELKRALEDRQIRSQTGIKERFIEGVKRSGRYMPAIEAIFKESKLPKELARLPLVESSFNYEAYSSVGAAGIWQFMRSTGRRYMRVNTAVDERRDPIVASRSAARYLKGAYKRLGEWPLAVTSYNHGVAGMARAVKKVGSKDLTVIIDKYKKKTFGFASSNFYAELLAAIEIEQNHEKYFKGLKIEEPWQFEEIKLAKSLNIKELQKVYPGNLDKLKRYNKGILKSVFQGRRSVPAGYLLRVPKGEGTQLAKNLKDSKVLSLSEGTKVASSYKPSKNTSTSSSSRTHRVRRGESLSTIARKFGVNSRSIMLANGIKNANSLRAGKIIKIPGSSSKTRSSSSQRRYHTVRRGQSLNSISKKYGTRLSSIRKLNPSLKSKIFPGQKIRVK